MSVCPKCRDYTRELLWWPLVRCLNCGHRYSLAARHLPESKEPTDA